MASKLVLLDTQCRACVDAKIRDLLEPFKTSCDLFPHFLQQLVPPAEIISGIMEKKIIDCVHPLLPLKSRGDVCARAILWENCVRECKRTWTHYDMFGRPLTWVNWRKMWMHRVSSCGHSRALFMQLVFPQIQSC